METSLHYSLNDKQLCFKLRERISTKPGLQLKGKGLLNTTTGEFDYRASLQRVFTVGPALAEGAAATPLRLGAGISTNTTTREKPMLILSARKDFALLEGPNTVLSVRADMDFAVHNSKASHRATVRLHQKFPYFTKQQDLRLTVGMDLQADKLSNPKPVRARCNHCTGCMGYQELYFQARENNWGLHYQKKALRVSYDL